MWGSEPLQGSFRRNVKRPGGGYTHEARSTICRENPRRVDLNGCGELRTDLLNLPTIKNPRCLGAIIEANHADVNIRPCKYPIPVALCKKDVTCLFDAFKYFAVCPACDGCPRPK